MPGAMPQNHARALREQRPLSRRAKWLWGLSGATLIAVVAVVIALSTGTSTKPGCIATYLPGVIGTQPYDECGSDARHTCASVRESRHQFGSVGVLIVAAACRKGHLPVG